jgi:hypothetical protein
MKHSSWFWILLPLTVAAGSPAAGQSCPGDFDGDNQVTVDELLQSVDRALVGCPSVILLGGPFDGGGVAARTACADPRDNGAILLEELTVTVTEQTDSRFSGRVDAVDEEGDDLSLNIDGSVDADGLIRGTVDDDEGEVTGTVHGGIAGDGLSLALLIFEPERSCSVAGSLLAVRR